MRLSPKLFEEITGCRESWSGQRPGRDKRQAARVPMPMQTQLRRVRGGVMDPPVAVKVREMSVRGIGLIVGDAMLVGEEILVRLPRKGAAPLWMHCTVARAHPVGPDAHVVGASFNCVADLQYAMDREEDEVDESPATVPAAAPEIGEMVERIRRAILA